MLLLLVVIVVPSTFVLANSKGIMQNHWLAASFVLIWEMGVLVMAIVSRVWQKLERDWIDAIADIIALRVSGFFYNRYYYQQLFYQYRYIDVKGLSTQNIYALAVEQVLVELGLDPKPVHQISSDPLQVPEGFQLKGRFIWDYLNSGLLSNQHLVIIGAPGSCCLSHKTVLTQLC